MRSKEILAWLDDEIERLQLAREILASSWASPTRRPKQKVVAKKTRLSPKKIIKVIEAELPPPVPAEEIAEPVQRLPRRVKAVVRRTVRVAKPVLTPTALSRQVPTGPVAVSAEEAQKARAKAIAVEAVPVAAEPSVAAQGERSLGSLIRELERREANRGTSTS